MLMAQLYFRHGTMNCSKSANLLMAVYVYESQNRNVLLFKPSLDIRSANGKIESRVGISHDCIDIDENFDIYLYIDKLPMNSKDISCILVDEGQFLTREQVMQLSKICDIYNIPIIVYGLKNSYVDGNLFIGSEALLYYADKIEEIKNVCVYCNKKAIMNLRIHNGKPIYSGDMIKCGDTNESEDYYVPTCRQHYYNPKLKQIKY